ncbi:MAG TPA: glycogen/starch/alpha-glucan phosphorylase [Thermoanaerobaculia bacterium]
MPLSRIVAPPAPKPIDASSVAESFGYHIAYSFGRDEYTATDRDAYQALAFAVRDRLMERWFATQKRFYETDVKRVYYLSLEFLLGRLLSNNIINLGAQVPYRDAMEGLGVSLEELASAEPDPGLGNGGLGRLAACFLDSAATLGLAFHGYGIRYEFGIFRQDIVEGEQREAPDAWLQSGNPWEIARPDIVMPVQFYGRVEPYTDEQGRSRVRWVDTEDVLAMAYDLLVPGYGNDVVNSLRLWAAKSTREFDLAKFNAGEYVAAVEDKFRTENISKVLYPPDDQSAGRELRVRQQYFFTSATIQDVIRRFNKQATRRATSRDRARRWEELPARVAIQLNDTHPAIAIPEMMRVLVDQEGVDWEPAWWICQHVFSYTNHTVLPEALESWPREMLARVLPRHMQIIEEIDRRFRASVSAAYPGDDRKLRSVAIVNDFTGNVRMANLAIVGSHAVNGVAKLHSHILQTSTFSDFHDFFPRRFTNVTNGITPRRWLLQANPELAELITEAVGPEWPKELERLRALEALAEDAAFRERWIGVRQERKTKLASWLRARARFDVDPDSLFDVQVKRIHEYKRQLLNAMHAVHLYHRILEGADVAPRTIIFGGTAAPGYRLAKLIIALIHAVANLLRARPAVAKRVQVVFVPNYGVSAAEMIFPATELSEQISTAGTEASGTGCMKSVLNGGIIIGTLDGANIEIRDEAGEDNLFVFGHTADEIIDLRERGYEPARWIERSPSLGRVIETIRTLEGGRFAEIAHLLGESDRFAHCADFDSYVEAQERAAAAWADRHHWTRMSILNTARSGRFSADRTVAEYAKKIWGV